MGLNKQVDFTTAKLLKEKGFDVPVRNYYLQKEKGNYLHEGFEDSYWGDNRIVNWNKDIVGIKPFEGFLSAPTIVEVVMWLYDNHKIWIVVFLTEQDWTFDIFKGLDCVKSESFFNTPVNTYESAIEYTLNNLV